MEIKLTPVSRHTYLIDMDDVTVSMLRELSREMQENVRDIMQMAVENGLTVIKETHLQKES